MAPKAQKISSASTFVALTALASSAMAFPQMSEYGLGAYGGPSGVASPYTGTGYKQSTSYGTGYSTLTSFSYGGTPTYTTSYPISTATAGACVDTSNLDSRCQVLFPFVAQNELSAVCEILIEAYSSGSDCGGGYSTVPGSYPGSTPTPSLPGLTSSSFTSATTFFGPANFSTMNNFGPGISTIASESFCADCISPSYGSPTPTSSASKPTGTGITYASPTISSAVDTPYPNTPSHAVDTPLQFKPTSTGGDYGVASPSIPIINSNTISSPKATPTPSKKGYGGIVSDVYGDVSTAVTGAYHHIKSDVQGYGAKPTKSAY